MKDQENILEPKTSDWLNVSQGDDFDWRQEHSGTPSQLSSGFRTPPSSPLLPPPSSIYDTPHQSQPVTVETSPDAALPTDGGTEQRTPVTPNRKICKACINCRRRKLPTCSQHKPACRRCVGDGLVCEYGEKLQFRKRNRVQWLRTEAQRHLEIHTLK